MEYTDKKILLGMYDPAKHPDFCKVEFPYSSKSNIFLQKEVLNAFVLMYDAAVKDGISLQIISATRNFDRQKTIWENKWTGITSVGGENLSKTITDPVKRAERILAYSSMPGTSRHHWGTDIDINSVSPAYFKSGKGVKEYKWLCSNAAKYGFCQPYQKKGTERMTGYEDEPWHWSYYPLSCKYTQDYLYCVTYNDIKGFLGDETAQSLSVIEKYVNGIHPDCKCR